MLPFSPARLLLCSLLTIGTMAQAGVDQKRGGEAGAANWRERYGVRSTGSEPVRLVDDPLGRAGKVFELSLHGAQKRGAAKRAEVYPLKEAASSGLRWYAFSVMLPGTWNAPGAPVTVARIDVDRPDAGLKPPLALQVEGRRLWLELHSSERPGRAATAQSVHTTRVPMLDNVARRQWYCVIVRADWQAELGQGALSVWLDSTLIYKSTRMNNGYAGYDYVPRVGLSAPGTLDTAGRKLYADFIWLGAGGDTTHKKMHDKTPCARRR